MASYCSLRELVPQDDSSWEEALLVGGVRSPDLVEARVVASSHSGFLTNHHFHPFDCLLLTDSVHTCLECLQGP